MKGAVIALICAAALAQAELNENGCPINPYVDVLKPHPDCNKYYQCTQGELLERQCASDLVFDVETQSCDWPAKVDCNNRIPPTPGSSDEENQTEIEDGGNSDPSEAPKICADEGSDGVLVAHENCNQFYVCDAGTPVARVCWGNLLFNPVNDQCDWPKNVNCGDRIVGGGNDGGDSGSADGGDGEGDNGDSDSDVNGDPSEAPKICAVDGSDGVLIAHENCNQFYKCNRGIPVTLDCWGNLLFNPTNNQCDWPDNVDCGNRIIGGGIDGGDGGNEDSGNGEGGNGDSGNGGNSDPSEAPKICNTEGSDGVLIAHEHCKQFYKCNGGKPVALDCSGNLLFNPANNQCDWPDNVNCGDRIISGGNGGGNGGNGNSSNETSGNGDTSNGGNSDPSEAPKICDAKGSDGVLVAHENCNQFYKCSAGKPVALNCWGILLFNPANNQCDWPDNVNCGDRIIGGGNGSGDGGNGAGGNGDGSNEDGGNGNAENGGNSDPSEAPKICAAEGSDGVLVAHENCTQFYKCNEGKPVAFDCGGDLLFNPAINQCDWHDNVNCGERIIGGEISGKSEDNGDGGIDDGSNETSFNEGNSNLSQAPKICADEGSDGILVVHENCNQFYICVAGAPVARVCWGNLLFNPTKNQCDWPDVVNCGNRIFAGGSSGEDSGNRSGDNEDSDNGNSGDEDSGTGGNGGGHYDPSKAEEVCADENFEDVLVAHEDCNKFYQCKRGKPVVRVCYGELYFNLRIDACDWPHNVNCGSRNKPIKSYNKLNRHTIRV